MDVSQQSSAKQALLSELPPSEEAAVWAYRLILGREPENAQIVRDHVKHSASLAELRERFLECSEFTQRYRSVERERGRNVSVFPPCTIQTDVDAETRERLFARVADSWRHQGETEPYWSVMSQPEYLMERIGETREAFLESGRENVERLLATLRRNGVSFDPSWEVLELGCGLGRSTRWLALHASKIWGVDISVSHLRLAQQLNIDAPCAERIEWLELDSFSTLQNLPRFDLFFSMIVLQHNPPPVIAMMLETVAARLRPGGVAFFQVPTYQRGYSFNAESYLALREDVHDIEMHAFPQQEVFRIFRDQNCIPLEVFEDGLSGHRDNHRSNSFLFRKLPETGMPDTAQLRECLVRLQTELTEVHVRASREHRAAQMALEDAARHYDALRAELDRLNAQASAAREADHAALAEAERHIAELQARCTSLQSQLEHPSVGNQ